MNAPERRFACLQQAAQWYAVLHADDATAQERARWQAWLAESDEHRQAWQQVENAGRRLAPLRDEQHRQASAQALQAGQSARRRKRRSVMRLVLLGAAGGAGAAIWRYTPVGDTVLALRADFHTGVGEIKEVVLQDGSHAWLNTATALTMHFSAQTRQLQLLAGEALFQSAADPGRPFVVVTPQGRMRALGTRFTVRRLEDSTRLSVFEGAVEIRPADGAAPQIVQAGQQASFTAAAIGPRQIADPASQAWRDGVLLADKLPLADFVAELARYRRVHISVSPQVAGLRVMGTYPARDIEQSLALVAAALSLKVRRILPWWIALEPATS